MDPKKESALGGEILFKVGVVGGSSSGSRPIWSRDTECIFWKEGHGNRNSIS